VTRRAPAATACGLVLSHTRRLCRRLIAAAPPDVEDFLRDYYIRYSGPAGMTEKDDMENWNYAHQASRGVIARRHPYSYEMGLGAAVENFEWDGRRIAGKVIDVTKAQSSEEPIRNLDARRAWFMEARQRCASAYGDVVSSDSG
jgi:hypothetical protein